jgi:hypothetical protein
MSLSQHGQILIDTKPQRVARNLVSIEETRRPDDSRLQTQTGLRKLCISFSCAPGENQQNSDFNLPHVFFGDLLSREAKAPIYRRDPFRFDPAK